MKKIFYKTTDSTNTRAREYVKDGGTAPALFVADEQSGGRGRQGKSFYSPKDTGIYMSLLFDVSGEPPRSVVSLTTAAAVAVSKSIKEKSGTECGIKWVNDIYIDCKKVCGILCELFGVGEKKYAIIGIGVNLCTQSFPEEISDIAGSLGTAVDKEQLTTVICKNVCDVHERLVKGDFSYMQDYRKMSVVLGKEIIFIQNGECFCGVAESINDLGGLCVRLKDGTFRTLESGEISLRLNKGEIDR